MELAIFLAGCGSGNTASQAPGQNPPPVPGPSGLSYPQSNIVATVGSPIATDTPTVSGTVSTYSVSPALPAGLSLNSSNGAVSGTPTFVSGQASYVVTASNSGGSTTAQLQIQVQAGTQGGTENLLDLGHAASIVSIVTSANRVLSLDALGHWNLWDYASGDSLANGNGGLTTGATQVALSASLAAVNTASGVQVLDPSAGKVIFTIPEAAWWEMAADGSYVCTGSSTALTVYSPSGAVVFARAGDYHAVAAFAAAGQIEIANRPAGANVIETVAVPSGADLLSQSFQGQFYSWFADGQNFFTRLSNNYWIYSLAGYQSVVIGGASEIKQIAGAGNYYWEVQPGTDANGGAVDSVEVSGIGVDSTSTAYYSFALSSTYIASGTVLAVLENGPAQLSLIDLSGGTPTRRDVAIPPLAFPTAFASGPGSAWIAGNQFGALLDGATAGSTPRYFGYGEALGVAAGSNTAAVATATGKILVFDLNTGTVGNTVDFVAGKVQMSSDGTVLAASPLNTFFQYLPDRTINIYAVPSLQSIDSIPDNYNLSNYPWPTDFTLSASGTVLGQVQVRETPDAVAYGRQASTVPGNQLTWADGGVQAPVLLSPDGLKVAVTSAPYSAIAPSQTVNAITNIYDVMTYNLSDNQFLTAVPGLVVGWIDTTHMLASTYSLDKAGNVQFSGSVIYNIVVTDAGVTVSSSPVAGLPAFSMSAAQFPTPTTVYDYMTNTVYSLNDGSVVWKGPQGQADSQRVTGAPAGGSRIVYEEGNLVTVSTY